jgi:hypothetical protein
LCAGRGGPLERDIECVASRFFYSEKLITPIADLNIFSRRYMIKTKN